LLDDAGDDNDDSLTPFSGYKYCKAKKKDVAALKAGEEENVNENQNRRFVT
jgi:hypothetical protein